MSEEYNHGVRVLEVKTGGRTLRTIATAIIGLVATGPAADAAMFPANQLVVINGGNIDAAIAAAGATGTLRGSLQAIANQASTFVIVGRAVQGAAPIDTVDKAVVAMIKQLRVAEALVGYKPRIIGAPGLDTEAVTTELALTAAKLRGRAYASCNGANTVASILTYRAKFSARELMLIAGDFTADSGAVTVNGVATALGLRAKIDQTIGWNKTISNVPVAAVTGIANPFFFDLQDSSTDVGALNAAGVTCLVNFDGALRFWGSRTCSSDPDFVFESAVATAQVLADTCARGLAAYVDGPITPSMARDAIEEINTFGRRLKTSGLLIDCKAYLPESNTAETLSAGGLRIGYRFTPTPPLEDLTLQQEITEEFLSDFAAQVAA
ncbi:phage tail sheath subtilisin-like domain-containing protein [Caulobacter segnis]|uniref:Phage tail protein n=1 Tax=Caulobacter segnis TaxID=88688 RepID=A0A2W5VPE1_9CAUL|nr:phage tail sheath subtilisin-like domain-containing protein [Caulobacter segnis]PZR37185.1 MAG: phage tail protein [Caulobacter segnis]